jgi:outer membrane murein-binding lipoprotein Lpp
VSNCDQFRDMIEAYALGALDPEDHSAFEAHLATGCANCAKAVDEARWLVSQLAYSAPDAAPSDMLKGRLMQTVRAQGQPKPLVPRYNIPSWMWIAAGVLLIFSLYSTWKTGQLERQIREANERAATLRIEKQKTEEQLAAAKREAMAAMIMMDPASHKIDLWGKGAHPETLEAKWHSKLGICVSGDKVPMPAANHVLQVWFIPKKEGAKPMPSMMVRPDASGKLMMLISDPPVPMDDTKSIAITEEPAGGSPWPTSAPIWSANVS